MEDDPIRMDTRLAGQVLRYHTWPTHRKQTIAEHTWNCLRIYFSVTDNIDPHIVFLITFHDVGEHHTGDIPFPVKRDNPKLRAEINDLENQSLVAQLDFWDTFKCHENRLTTDYEKWFMKQIELVEMAEFGLDEMCLGNSHGQLVAERILKNLYQNMDNHPRLFKYIAKRLTIFYEQFKQYPTTEMSREWWNPSNWEKLNDNGE